MRSLRYISLLFTLAALPLTLSGQADRKDVRRGNRLFSKDKFQAAEISYRKGLMADSTSFASAYNLASALYREGNYVEAASTLDKAAESAAASPRQADWLYNKGDAALQTKDYQAAVEAFGKALLLNPDDIECKENFIYARKMLQNQQGGGGGNDQNQDQNQDQQGGGDQDQQNKDQDQNQQDQNQQDQNQQDQNQQDQNQQDQNQQDQNKDQNQDQQNQQNQDQNKEQNPKEQEEGLSSQQARQMLQAMQALEKETQEKVDKKKALLLQSRQKDKNW